MSPHKLLHGTATLAALLLALPAHAQQRREIATPAGLNLPNGTSAGVWAGNLLYVSGSLDPDIKLHHDTESQTVGVIKFLQRVLEQEKLTLGDVIMMHVYLHADSAKGNTMDFNGMMAGWTQFFGTREQPNKPARTTVQVTLPAGARGGLIEIDLVAMKREKD